MFVAYVLQAAGAAGLIIVNTNDKLMHPPGPDAPDLGVFLCMVSRGLGGVLLAVSTLPQNLCRV